MCGCMTQRRRRCGPVRRLIEKEDVGTAVRPYLMDLGSTNGTFLNDERLEPQRYYELLEKVCAELLPVPALAQPADRGLTAVPCAAGHDKVWQQQPRVRPHS